MIPYQYALRRRLMMLNNSIKLTVIGTGEKRYTYFVFDNDQNTQYYTAQTFNDIEIGLIITVTVRQSRNIYYNNTSVGTINNYSEKTASFILNNDTTIQFSSGNVYVSD